MIFSRRKQRPDLYASGPTERRSSLSGVRSFLIFAPIALFFLLYISGCFRVPERPQWDMPFSIPFAERIYSLSDLIKVRVDSVTDTALNAVRHSEDHGFYGLGNDLVFYSSGRVKTQAFGERLHSNSTVRKNFNYSIDTLELDSMNAGSVSFAATLLVPDSLRNHPATLPTIPVNTTRAYDNTGSNFVYFQYFSLAAGTMYVRIANSMPTALDNVSFELQDTLGTPVGSTNTFPSILPGTTITDTMHFTVAPRISALMRIRMAGSIRGGTNVTVRDSSHIQLSLFTSRLRVTEAFAVIPRQHAFTDTILSTGVNDSILHAEVKRGQILVRIHNGMSVVADSMRINFPDFHRLSDHSSLTAIYRNVPPGFLTDTMRLDSSYVDLVQQQFHFTGDAYTRPTGNQMVAVGHNDNINFSYVVDTLYFYRFTGIPDSIAFDFDTTVTRVTDRPQGVTNLGLVAAELVVSPHSYGDSTLAHMPVLMDYHLVAYHGNQRPQFDTTNQYFPSMNTVSRVPGVQGIINIIPDSVKSYGKARLGKHFPQMRNMGIIRVAESDSISSYATLEGRMMFRLQPQDMTPDSQMSRGQSRPFRQINFRISGENHLPVGGRVNIQIKGAHDTAWTSLGGSNVAAPPIIHSTYRPDPLRDSTRFDTTLILNNTMVNYFKLDTFYTRATLNLTGTGLDTVLCKTTDYIRINTGATIILNTGEVQ